MAPPAAAGQFFSPTETLPAEMARLSKLRREEPETAATIGQFGEKMVALAKAGNMRQLCAMLSSVPEGFMLQWYVVKMFREACDANQVHVVQFMLDNGVPIKAPPLLDTLHNVVAQARKNQAAFSPLLRVLVKGGFDPNYQKPDAYLTALHVACDEDLVDMAQVLIEEGADVNAVAEDDVMPLNCADKVAAQAQGGAAQAGEDKQTPDQAEEALTPMQKLLLSKGAKRTWRKTETSAEALRKQRLQDFYDAEKEAGEGRRTFSGGSC